MNIEVQLRKGWDFINSQPPIFRILLLIAVVLFIVLPFSIPVAVYYFIRACRKHNA